MADEVAAFQTAFNNAMDHMAAYIQRLIAEKDHMDSVCKTNLAEWLNSGSAAARAWYAASVDIDKAIQELGGHTLSLQKVTGNNAQHFAQTEQANVNRFV